MFTPRKTSDKFIGEAKVAEYYRQLGFSWNMLEPNTICRRNLHQADRLGKSDGKPTGRGIPEQKNPFVVWALLGCYNHL